MLNILNCTPIAQFAIDLKHNITHWNKACEKLTGLSAKKMIGTKNHWAPFYDRKRPVLADLIVDNRIHEIKSMYRDNDVSRSEEIPSAWEATGFFKNIGGKDRHFYFLAAPILDQHGNILGAIETVQDITRRVMYEKELRDSEERYRVLTKQVADGVALIQKGKLKFLNDAFCSIFGYSSKEELLNKETIELISSQDRSIYENFATAFAERRFDVQTIEIQCTNADGEDFWVESHNTVISWEGKRALLVTIRNISERKMREQLEKQKAEKLRFENSRLRNKIKSRFGLGQLVGKSRAMQTVYDAILKTSTSNANVIIYGESGSGKELVARAVHEMSDRGEKPFIAVNCGAIPENLFESEFFGHKKGAFTGASFDKCGYLESAQDGILFLDEVGEIPLSMQVKLLRALDGGGFTPIGSTQVKHADTRIIAATNRNLKKQVRCGQMREDFFYRIHIIPIHVPPLRDRKDDLALLIYHFMQQLGKAETESFLPDNILRAMQSYDWPGNVRELQNVIQRYATFKTLGFPSVNETTHVLNSPEHQPSTPQLGDGFILRNVLEDFEKDILLKAMAQVNGNRTRAAVVLGTERRSLQRKLKRYQLV